MTIQDDKQKAIIWADSLINEEARASAISAVYQRWSLGDPSGAVHDILTYYPDALELMSDAFKGAAETRSNSATFFWDTALELENTSARAFATSGLLEPMLLQSGLALTQEKINTLPEGSLERKTAELTLKEIIKRPIIAVRIKELAEMAQ